MWFRKAFRFGVITIMPWLTLQGCIAPPAGVTPAVVPAAPVTVTTSALAAPGPCLGHFVAHDLDHTTTAPGEVIRLFDSNGAGLAVNDMDGDGDQDIVLADLNGPAHIFWNEGGLTFRRDELPLMRRARAVAAVDVEGDGLLDLVFTNGVGSVAYFRNDGAGGFQLTPLPGVDQPAYAMHWADWDADGDLDLVTGSYDAGLLVEQANTLLIGERGGATYYAQEQGRFVAHPLAGESQALAVVDFDANGDGRPDIVIGNDFDLPDYVFLQQPDGDWTRAEPFRLFTHSTMGFDTVDTDNDGRWELFATDMKPYRRDPVTMAAWVPLMEDAYASRLQDDPQRSENILQVPDIRGEYENKAYVRGLSATGWSWSAKFGDLDNDGDQDLYAVNGMIAADMLDHLQDGELVEENQALRNDGGDFAPAPEWQLNATRSGRSMSMADLDEDGDLDIVINNLNSPALLLENRLCGGSGLLVDLEWPAGRNPFGLGAVATLHTDMGDQMRRVRAAGGYLSGDPARLHFGISDESTIQGLTISWPDGATSRVEAIEPGMRVVVTRTGR